MIPRHLSAKLLDLASQFPVVTLTGPRQSGKTTLCRAVFPDYDYANLEELDVRQEAVHDPRGFLSRFVKGVVIDEIQRAPDLTSYIQGEVDRNPIAGKFILTGSQQFEVTNTINQSLAGRTAVLRLLPFSLDEIFCGREECPAVPELLFTGFYPRIHDQNLNPHDALSAYVSTYVERDIRSLSNLRNLDQFERFVGICAANIGQLVNYSRFSNDVGVDQETIKAWISLLKASYIVFTLQTHAKSYRKRVTKSPKLYFYDVGLASYLLGVTEARQLERHPLAGSLFENMIIADILKERVHSGESGNLFFFRDHVGNEVDLIIDEGLTVKAVEIKLGSTLSPGLFNGLKYYKKLAKADLRASYLVHGGNREKEMYDTRILPYFAARKIITETISDRGR